MEGKLLAAKAYYLLTFACGAFVYPYLNVYFRRLGFSEQRIGLLAALRPWVAAVSGNVWAGLADGLSGHRWMLITLFVLSTASRCSIAFAGASFTLLLVLVISTEALASPVGIIADAAIMAACNEVGADYGKQRLWGAVGWGGFSAIAGTIVSRYGIMSGFEAYAFVSAVALIPMTLLPTDSLGNRSEYSSSDDSDSASDSSGEGSSSSNDTLSEQLPISTPVQHGVHLHGHHRRQSAPVEVGKLSNEHEEHGEHTGGLGVSFDEAWHLIPHFAPVPPHLEVLTPNQHQHSDGALQEPLLAAEEARAREESEEKPAPSFGARVALLLRDPEAVVFFVMATVMGFGAGSTDSFLFLYLEELGGNPTLMGMTLTVTCAAEVPVFFFTGHLLRRLGAALVLNACLAAFVLRLLAYIWLPAASTPWAVLPVELLGGVIFGCFWAAGTITCGRISPSGLEATTQGIFQGLFAGVGSGLGALVGGIIYKKHGAQAVFLTAAMVLAGGWALCLVLQLLVRCWHLLPWSQPSGTAGESDEEQEHLSPAAQAA